MNQSICPPDGNDHQVASADALARGRESVGLVYVRTKLEVTAYGEA